MLNIPRVIIFLITLEIVFSFMENGLQKHKQGVEPWKNAKNYFLLQFEKYFINCLDVLPKM